MSKRLTQRWQMTKKKLFFNILSFDVLSFAIFVIRPFWYSHFLCSLPLCGYSHFVFFYCHSHLLCSLFLSFALLVYASVVFVFDECKKKLIPNHSLFLLYAFFVSLYQSFAPFCHSPLIFVLFVAIRFLCFFCHSNLLCSLFLPFCYTMKRKLPRKKKFHRQNSVLICLKVLFQFP